MRKPFVFLSCALILSVTTSLRADEKIDPTAVVDKAIKALGGADKIAKYKAESFKMKGKFYGMGEGIDYDGEWDVQYPDKTRFKVESDVNGMKFGFSRSFDGDKLWVKMGTDDATEVKDKDEIKEAKENAYASNITRLLPLKEDKSLKIEVVGESKVDGKPAIGLRVSSKGHRDVNLYFDKDKGLLVKSETMVKDAMTGDKEQMQETIYSNYKEMGGVQRPTKVVINREGKKYVDGELTEFTAKEKIDDKVFGKP
jgi:hypothetical protein